MKGYVINPHFVVTGVQKWHDKFIVSVFNVTENNERTFLLSITLDSPEMIEAFDLTPEELAVIKDTLNENM